MDNARRRPIKGERGATIVEAAIVLPLYFFLVFALYEFVISFQQHLVIAEAAREATRTAVVREQGGSCEDISNRAQDELEEYLSRYGFSVHHREGRVRARQVEREGEGAVETLRVELDLGISRDNTQAMFGLTNFFSFGYEGTAVVPLEGVDDMSGCE